MPSLANDPGDLTSSEARAHPLAFYRRFFAGWTQEELSAQAPIVYQRLRRRGLLRLIPAKNPPFGGDPLAYYRQHYAGLTRGQLQNLVPAFYDHLRRNGLLHEISLKPKVSFPDSLAYYQEHCAGMTRIQLSKYESQFYRYLVRHSLLGTIPFVPAAAGRDAQQQERCPAAPRSKAERLPGRGPKPVALFLKWLFKP